MNNNNSGIFDLITELCEKFEKNPSKIKNVRSKCYEVLLGKRTIRIEKKFRDLSTKDPFCNLIAWQYVLSHQYNSRRCAEQIADLHKLLSDTYKVEGQLDTYNNILTFLLSLRNIPSIQHDQMDLSILPEFGPNPDFNSLFKLPVSILSQVPQYSNSTFYLDFKKKQSNCNELQRVDSCTCSEVSCKSSYKTVSGTAHNEDDEVFHEEDNEESVWEIAAREPFCKRKTWETYGQPEPDKEPIFLSELGDLSSLWVDNLHSTRFNKYFRDGVVFRSEIKSKKKFIGDLKYLLVGMASESFTYNDFGELIMIPDITLEGLTEETLEEYSKNFTLSGTCYKALYEMSLPDPQTSKYKCNGYIYAELCESISKYLQFYRTAIMSIPNSMNLLEFSEKTSPLRIQINTVASICKVGPYKESEEIPHGVALLNYLYQKVIEIIDKNIILVLYSILFPCCQIYFGRFILQWILYGSVNDPYDEFFIKTNYKYLTTRGRTYWTRSFVIRPDIIPEFLNDLKETILLCGKMMNLLKFCNPFNKLCLFLMGKKPHLISCCITRDQLILLEQSAQTYYLEALEFCGRKHSIAFLIRKEKEINEDLLEFISQKRAATLKRIELERQKFAQEEYDKKLEERATLKEQYDIALHQKQFNILQDIEREIKSIETSIQIAKKREYMIQQEAKDLIEYYEHLFQISDAKRERIEKHIEALKKYQLDPTYKTNQQQDNRKDEEKTHNGEEQQKDLQTEENPNSLIPEINIGDTIQNNETPQIHSAKSLDELNANLEEEEEEIVEIEQPQSEKVNNNDLLEEPKNDNFKQTLENFETAKRNKRKVMNEELGLRLGDSNTDQPKSKVEWKSDNLTDAQKNRMRVMSSEFDIEIKPRERIEKELTITDINKFKMMTSTVFSYENYTEKKVDNENTINRNNTKDKEIVTKDTQISNQMEQNKQINEKNEAETKIKKSTSLSLDLNFKRGGNSEMDKCLPMSVDSTPFSDIASVSTISATSRIFPEDRTTGSFPTTAGTEMTDDGAFNFTKNYNIPDSPNIHLDKAHFSKVVSVEDVENIKPMCLKMFLGQSLSYSLVVQSKLVSSELLNYFVEDLRYLQHLRNLRNYFFLQDGEFGKTITDILFQKLYSVKFPIELINCRVLSYIIHGSLDDSNKTEGIDNLSFKINSLPDCFNLCDVDVLNCLSLTYKVEWPLNILLPKDAVAKYNDVFKFLLKIKRMNWILKKMFKNLRMLAKETGTKEQFLMISIHYRRIHLFRYVMMHFVQSLENYITGEIFQTQWAILEENLEGVTNLDELYDAHTNYLKNILFMCLLTQRSAPLKRVLDKIFTVILKFYDILRSKKWECTEGTFMHPSFKKLETMYENFNELVLYLFKVGKKVVKNGYQPQFKHFLDSLDTNGIYSKISCDSV
ncbi:gamma-tubulin complex component 6 [Coccinella septempunctata]|uniref:gamma-tubulin complex component 6 n=1 Tax=Coccinella septempunctata TaxID=41139 RepID=UPI001D081AFE|nr:gamma-tubulin complex component 6 [Coccinella septempunctata]